MIDRRDRPSTALGVTTGAAGAACDLAAFLIPAIVFILSCSKEPGQWDTGELQGVPYLLGITHPTGFPFYVMLGWVWSHAVPISTVAFRMNVMSALCVALAALCAYGVARLIGAPRTFALIATLWFAFTQDVWQHGSRAEAHDLSLACTAVAAYSLVRWMKGDRDRWLFAAAGAFTLGCATHPNAVWFFPGFALAMLVAKRRPRWRIAVMALLVAVSGVLLYAYLPLRSQYVVAHGLDPTRVLEGVNGGIFWNYNNPSTPHGLWMELTGSETSAPKYFLETFWPWHWQGAILTFVETVAKQFGTFTMLLVLAGAVFAWRRDWRTTLALIVACTAALIFSVVYANETDRGRFQLLAVWLCAPLLAALAPQERRGDPRAWLGSALLAVYLIAGTAQAFWVGRGFFEHSESEQGRWIIEQVRPFVPPGSVIISEWIDATSLAYGAYVDGTLPDRIIVSGWRQEKLPLYRQWARRRPVFVIADFTTQGDLDGTKIVYLMDGYHQLFRVEPH